MWKMLQQKKSLDLVIGSGKSYSIKDFLNQTFKLMKLEKKVLINRKNLLRKIDILEYRSNPLLAKKKIKWKNNLSLKKIIIKMINDEYY